MSILFLAITINERQPETLKNVYMSTNETLDLRILISNSSDIYLKLTISSILIQLQC